MPAETRRLVDAWRIAREKNEACALATVVRVSGSSYRKPGARMLLTSASHRVGTVSGGCLEGEVSRKIWWLTEGGPAVQDYATSYDDDSHSEYGLGCDGVVTLLLERTPQANVVFQALRNAIDERIASAIVTVIGTDAQEIKIGSRLSLYEDEVGGGGRESGLPPDLHGLLLPIAEKMLDERQSGSRSISFGESTLDIFAEYIAPPPALFVFGAGDDAQPVVQLANSMGWEIAVADGRSNLATKARFPLAHRVVVIDLNAPLRILPIRDGDAAVVLTHSYVQDMSILRALLPLHLGYLGVLGPRRRTERIVEEIAPSLNLNPRDALAALRSPVGLDLGVGSPDVIALSIAAEIQATLNRRSGAPLNRSVPLASAAHD